MTHPQNCKQRPQLFSSYVIFNLQLTLHILYTFYASSICFGIWFVWSDLGIGQREMVCSSDHLGPWGLLTRSELKVHLAMKSCGANEVGTGFAAMPSQSTRPRSLSVPTCPNMSQHVPTCPNTLCLRYEYPIISHSIPALSRLDP